MPILLCKRVMFYSPGDERAFFEFAESVKGVRKIDGISDTIRIHTASRLSNASLRDLLALFRRYKIDMRQLREFLTPQNREWFRDKQKYWYQKVFRD